jgi:VanZ family protein
VSDTPSRPAADASRVRRWSPPLAWATALLVATSWPNPQVPDVRGGDKVVHALMYAGLSALAWRAAFPSGRLHARLVGTLAIVGAASAFGWVDEWHQQFIPGRSRDVADWQADTLGAGLGVLGVALTRRRKPTT